MAINSIRRRCAQPPETHERPSLDDSRASTIRLESERLYLRPLQLTDANERYLCWMRDPDVTRYLECRFAPCTPGDLGQYVAGVSADPNAVFFAIVLKEMERHVGNIKLASINRTHGTAEVGLMIGEKDCWNKGYAMEAIRLVTAYAFDVLGLHKLTAGCYDVNPASARAFLKAGWVREGLRSEQFECEGRRVGQILLGAAREPLLSAFEE